jgi:hypothetical protein
MPLLGDDGGGSEKLSCAKAIRPFELELGCPELDNMGVWS